MNSSSLRAAKGGVRALEIKARAERSMRRSEWKSSSGEASGSRRVESRRAGEGRVKEVGLPLGVVEWWRRGTRVVSELWVVVWSRAGVWSLCSRWGAGEGPSRVAQASHHEGEGSQPVSRSLFGLPGSVS